MFVFSIQLCELLPLSNVLSGSPSPHSPLPCVKVQYIQTLYGWEGVGSVLSLVGDHILQEFNTLYLTRFRTYKIARPLQTITQEGRGASDRYTPAAKSLYRSMLKMTKFCIAFYQSYLSTFCMRHNYCTCHQRFLRSLPRSGLAFLRC